MDPVTHLPTTPPANVARSAEKPHQCPPVGQQEAEAGGPVGPPAAAVPSVSRLVWAGVTAASRDREAQAASRKKLEPHGPLAAPHSPLRGSALNRHRSWRRGLEP